MPRTGGVYSPPSGTKGVSNTTIQSVPYNAFVDDLTADANAARPITAGGTGATSASAARSALGLAIGTNVQAYDAGLQSISGLTTAANQMIYTTALDVYATTALTPFARTLLDDVAASDVRTTLGLGTSAVKNTGTSGDAVPLLNGTNTWSGPQTIAAAAPALTLTDTDTGVDHIFSANSAVGSLFIQVDQNSEGSAPVFRVDVKTLQKLTISETSATFSVPIAMGTNQAISFAGTGAATTRTNLGLGTAATQNTGTSGANLPFMNGANTWSAVQTFTNTGGGAGDTWGGRLLTLQNFAPGIYMQDDSGSAYNAIINIDSSLLRFWGTPNADGTSLTERFSLNLSTGAALFGGTLTVTGASSFSSGSFSTTLSVTGASTLTGRINFGERIVSTGTDAIIGTTSAGQVILRPNGGDGAFTTGQLVVTASALTWAGETIYHSGNVVPVADGGTGATTASGARTNLGLGTAAVKNTGTSGDAVPLLNAANTWSASQIIDNGTSYVQLGISRSGMTGSFEALATPSLRVGTVTDHDFLIKRNESNVATFGSAAMALATNYAISFAGTGAATTRTNLGLGGLAVMDVDGLFYTGSSSTNTSFPVGSIIVTQNTAGLARNASMTPALNTVTTEFYIQAGHANAGSSLTGTWRGRGRCEISDGLYIIQRVA